MFAVGVGGGDVQASVQQQQQQMSGTPCLIVSGCWSSSWPSRSQAQATLSDRAAGRLQQGAHPPRFRERVGPCMTGLGISNSERPEARVEGEKFGCGKIRTVAELGPPPAYSTPHRALIGGKSAIQWAGRVGRSGCSKVWWKKIVLCFRLFSPLEALGEYRKNSTPTCCFPTTIDSAFGIQTPNRNHASLYPNRNQCRVSAITPIHVYPQRPRPCFCGRSSNRPIRWSSISNSNNNTYKDTICLTCPYLQLWPVQGGRQEAAVRRQPRRPSQQR